jgi:hypothetical protein
MRKESYERRIVAMVDILGFSEIVQQARTKADKFKLLRDVLNTVEGQVNRLEEYRQLCNPPPSHRVSFLSRTDIRMAAFSDCYLISDECSDEVSGAKVMTAVQALGSHLLTQGILTRGAIVCGEAYHDDRIAFGPAIIKAHKIEQDVAKYPRIIVTDEVLEALDWEIQTFWEGIVRRDIDGSRFINVFTTPLSASEPIVNNTTRLEEAEFLAKIRTELEKKLNQERATEPANPESLKKLTNLKWTIHYFNLEAEKHRLPRIENAVDSPTDSLANE